MTVSEILLLLLLAAATGAAWWWRARGRAAAARHARELTDLREAHAAARHAHEARMEAMLDSMVEGLVVLDAQGRIVLANRAAERLFGFSRMMAGGTLLEAIRNHEVAALAAGVGAGSDVLEREVTLESPGPRVLQINAAALHDATGVAAGVVLVFHDVTRLRQLETLRHEFVANVSHELRTPLSLIKSAVETLIDGGKDDPAVATSFLAMIDKHANRLTLLIDDLLLLARLDSGHIELKLKPVPLRAAAQDAIDDATLIAQARRVTLDNRVPAEVAAHADPERLHQVLANLIDNAIKYGREGGTVTLGGRALEDGRVQLTVRDDGPGIAAEAQARIFERFYRVDKARSREQGGTGLGLAIVKNIVQAHGGEVRVESAPDRGTEFFITLSKAKAVENM